MTDTRNERLIKDRAINLGYNLEQGFPNCENPSWLDFSSQNSQQRLPWARNSKSWSPHRWKSSQFGNNVLERPIKHSILQFSPSPVPPQDTDLDKLRMPSSVRGCCGIACWKSNVRTVRGSEVDLQGYSQSGWGSASRDSRKSKEF